MRTKPIPPHIPFGNYFQLNVPFGGLFAKQPVFKGYPTVFRGTEVSGDDGGCINTPKEQKPFPCQPIKPSEVGSKISVLA